MSRAAAKFYIGFINDFFMYGGTSGRMEVSLYLYKNSVQPGSQAAYDFVADGIAFLGNLPCRNFFLLVDADEHGGIPSPDSGNARDVYDGLIHADSADNRRSAAADQDASPAMGELWL